jgi:hypothetical protein
VTKEIREEIKKFLESNENEKCNLLESAGHSKGHSKGIVNSYKCLHKKPRDLSN